MEAHRGRGPAWFQIIPRDVCHKTGIWRFWQLDIGLEMENLLDEYRTLKKRKSTTCYFGKIYYDSSLLLSQIIDQFGQWAFVGKVSMDLNNIVLEYKEIATVRELDLCQKYFKRIILEWGPLWLHTTLFCFKTLMGENENIAKAHFCMFRSEDCYKVGTVKKTYMPVIKTT